MLQFHEIAADVRAKVFFFIRSVPIQESMSYTQTQCRTQRLGFFRIQLLLVEKREKI